jgi:hypothetical protein
MIIIIIWYALFTNKHTKTNLKYNYTSSMYRRKNIRYRFIDENDASLINSEIRRERMSDIINNVIGK